MTLVTLHEYGLLERQGTSDSLGCVSIPASAWDWLLSNTASTQYRSEDDRPTELVRPIRKQGKLYLQVMNYCGVLETPQGIRIEILPKTVRQQDDIISSRRLLYRMLCSVLNMSFKAFESSSLQVFSRPLVEVLITRFLQDVGYMLKRGVRSDYVRQEEELKYLKGRLLTAKQIRQRPGRDHFFHVQFDEYLPDRPENRLVHSALYKVSRWARSPDNQRLARELLFTFTDIPKSTNYRNDFDQWQDDRGMSHYQGLKPWCEMILNEESPLTLDGKADGLSFLFPMEILFERYVALSLRKTLSDPYKLKEQTSSKSLVSHSGANWFRLKPDLTILKKGQIHLVLDTKWKMLDSSLSSSKDKYNLSQSDFYQLFAYGQKYLNGHGEMMLIYPMHERLLKPLPKFSFNEDLHLWVIPFDLESGKLVDGAWSETLSSTITTESQQLTA